MSLILSKASATLHCSDQGQGYKSLKLNINRLMKGLAKQSLCVQLHHRV